MDIYPDTSEPATWTITADTSLATATAAVYLNGGWRDLTWNGAQTGPVGGVYTRSASLRAKGANAAVGNQVTDEDGVPRLKVTIGDQVIIRSSSERFTVRD